MPKNSVLLPAFALAILAGVETAPAQTYPARPITVVVPFAAGGTLDVVSRIITERMRTVTRAAGCDRKHRGRRRQHRCRTGRARGLGWLHAHQRPLGHARRQRREL